MGIRFFCVVIISCIFWQKGWSQDAEFSQFYAAPVHLNPAMIGFSEAPRITVNVRDQWVSFSNAFVTSAISYDQYFYKIKSSIGVSVSTDFAGGVYNTYVANASYAYRLQLNNRIFINAGVQAGLYQIGINEDKLVFRDMIDPGLGIDNASLPTAEAPLARTHLMKFDLSAGLFIYTKTFYVGASVKHLTTPHLSFTDIEDESNKLKIRTAVHAGKTFYLTKALSNHKRLYITPNFLFANQDKFFQLTAGAYLGKGKLFGGIWARHTIRNFDSLIGMIGFKSGIFKVGYSYDHNLASIGVKTGSHEVSLSLDFGENPELKKKQRMRNSMLCPEIFK